MPKKRRGTGHAASRKTRRSAALAAAADAAARSGDEPGAVTAARPARLGGHDARIEPLTTPSAPPGEPTARRRRRAVAVVAVAGVAVVLLAVLAALTWGAFDGGIAGEPNIVVGTPGGDVVAIITPTSDPTPIPTPRPSPEPTVEPTVQPTPIPTVVPTQPPAPTPSPATPPPPPPTAAATPAPTPIVVAAVGPADSVAAFYGHVAAGRYDAAYGLWSERMRTTYPRRANLDDRFDETASITFEQLYVAEQGAGRATVQANFVETYESGSSRRFIGYWRLVLVDGQWLLDEPHY